MSNFSYDDFAVLVRSFSQNRLDPNSLRIVPLSDAPSMADAIKGIPSVKLNTDETNANLPKEKNGNVVPSNVTVQHDSAGYCRLVGHIEAKEGQGAVVKTAKAFVLYHLVKDKNAEGVENPEVIEKPEVIAVASLKEGFEIGDGCYPSFTITTVNNYQSVAFNPNAFATVEDLKNINGLDGLHIAFDTASGDLKLIDKDGNVIDQANLPIKADVIIADGEEGYKYVKTDVAQDIHAAKAWMPEGQTAWEDVPKAPYEMKHAALVVEKVSTGVFVEGGTDTRYPISTEPVTIRYVEIGNSIYMVAEENGDTCSLFRVKGDNETGLYYGVPISNGSVRISDPTSEGTASEGHSYTIKTGDVEVDVIKDGGITYVLGNMEHGTFQPLTTSGESHRDQGSIDPQGGSSVDRVLGITLDRETMYTFDESAETPSKIKNISGVDVRWLDIKTLPEVPTLKYGLEAFVWTVKDSRVKLDESFFQQLNDSLLALGFHEGDDIALGTNLAILAPAEGVSPLNGVDADKYMHGKDNKAFREQEVDAQRKNAKEELVAWNAQHPGLTHDEVSGTRISSGGVDIRDGKISIGDGIGLGSDYVKHYELSTNFRQADDSKDEGLTLNVMDASNGNSSRNVLTISDSSYISGAPICMAMIEVTASAESGGALAFGLKRRTACFECGMSESEGTVNITITDKRLNSKGFATSGVRDDCIVEISPVYISRSDAPEMLPALNMVNTVATVSSTGGDKENDKLTCTCPQIIDWANSVNLPQGHRLFVIVKVY